jgi:hypothetical protein
MVLIGACNTLAGLTGGVTSSAVADGPEGTTIAGLITMGLSWASIGAFLVIRRPGQGPAR